MSQNSESMLSIECRREQVIVSTNNGKITLTPVVGDDLYWRVEGVAGLTRAEQLHEGVRIAMEHLRKLERTEKNNNDDV